MTEPASVAEFQQQAREVIAQLRGRGVTPVLVGGSALYTRAVLDRFDFPGTDDEVRGRLGGRARPGRRARAARRRWPRPTPRPPAGILPENGRRIVRALEVVELTGRPFSASLPRLEYVDPRTVQVGVDIDRDELDRRIERPGRRDVRRRPRRRGPRLLDAGLAEGRTASRAIGYREVAAYLAGETTEDEARAATKAATRRFARRQDSWFRKDPRVVWVRHDDPARLAIAPRRGPEPLSKNGRARRRSRG